MLNTTFNKQARFAFVAQASSPAQQRDHAGEGACATENLL